MARQEFTLQSLEADVKYQPVINERQKLETLKLKIKITGHEASIIRLESENVELRTDIAILKRDMNDFMTMLNQRKQ